MTEEKSPTCVLWITELNNYFRFLLNTSLIYVMLHFQDLDKKKNKYFGGDSITMIDYMMWPWFERLEVFGLKK